MDLLGGCFVSCICHLTAIMSPIKHVRVRLTLTQKKKLLEDSLKPGFDAVKAAKDYGIGLSTLYKILGQKEKFFSMVNQGKVTKKNVTTENSHLPFIIYNELVRLGKTRNKRNSRFKRQYAADGLFS